jgi:hypothetical protein
MLLGTTDQQSAYQLRRGLRAICYLELLTDNQLINLVHHPSHVNLPADRPGIGQTAAGAGTADSHSAVLVTGSLKSSGGHRYTTS